MSAIKRIHDLTINRIMGVTAAIAITLAAIGASQLCIYWYHQPKMPEQVRMLKKR